MTHSTAKPKLAEESNSTQRDGESQLDKHHDKCKQLAWQSKKRTLALFHGITEADKGGERPNGTTVLTPSSMIEPER